MSAEQLSVHDPGSPESPTILFLNGFLTNRSMWQPVIDRLGDTVRCITYDLRSFGENRLGDPVVSIEGHADDLDSIIIRSKLTRPLLCGHSLGGLVALRAVARNADRFAGVVVCGAHAKGASDDERLRCAKLIAKADAAGAQRVAAEYLKTTLAQDTLDQPDSPLDRMVGAAAAESLTAIKAALLAMAARVDTLTPLERNPIPLLITGGSEDAYTPPDALLRMGLGIEGAQFVRVPYAGHLAPVDNPEFFAGALQRFIASEPVVDRLPQPTRTRKKR